jgi:formate dehydrogenase assembly factor FdhD
MQFLTKHLKRRETVNYSEEFKAAVIAAFPSSERIRLMLDENSFSLGYSLSDGAISSIDPALVVSLLEAGKEEVLLKVANEAQERKKLYEMWKKEAYEA